MASQRLVDLVADIERVDVSPDELRRLTAAFEETLGREATDEKSRARADLSARLQGVRVARQGGEPLTLGTLITQIIEIGGHELLDNLSPETYLETTPFRELGRLPVADDPAAIDRPGVMRLRELHHIMRAESASELPLRTAGVKRAGNTHYMKMRHGWGFPLFPFILQYWASTEVTADGLDGAPYAGSYYAPASAVCTALQGIDEQWAKVMGQIWCGIANGAPRVPFPCYEISVDVVSGGSGSQSGDCGTSHKTGYSASLVEDTITTWAGGCPLAVSSGHSARRWKGDDEFWHDFP